jgi:hypothetical protein
LNFSEKEASIGYWQKPLFNEEMFNLPAGRQVFDVKCSILIGSCGKPAGFYNLGSQA